MTTDSLYWSDSFTFHRFRCLTGVTNMELENAGSVRFPAGNAFHGFVADYLFIWTDFFLVFLMGCWVGYFHVQPPSLVLVKLFTFQLRSLRGEWWRKSFIWNNSIRIHTIIITTTTTTINTTTTTVNLCFCASLTPSTQYGMALAKTKRFAFVSEGEAKWFSCSWSFAISPGVARSIIYKWIQSRNIKNCTLSTQMFPACDLFIRSTSSHGWLFFTGLWPRNASIMA